MSNTVDDSIISNDVGKLVKLLRRELKDEKVVRIDSLDSDDKARLYGLVLQGNKTVVKLDITTNFSHNNSITDDLSCASLLLDFIETSETLKVFALTTKCQNNEEFSRAFLEAAADNRNIEKVCIAAGDVTNIMADMICMLLQRSHSIKHLQLIHSNKTRGVDEWTTPPDVDVDLSDAFRNNETLECLTLSDWWDFEISTTPFSIFTNAIQSSASFRKLVLGPPGCSFDTASTKSLLDLICGGDEMHHSNVQFLEMDSSCYFKDENGDSMNRDKFFLNILSSKAATKLNEFKFTHCNGGGKECSFRVVPKDNVVNVANVLAPFRLRDFSGIPLVCLSMHGITQKQHLTLIQLLPRLRGLQKLRLYYLKGSAVSLDSESFQHAVRKNHCLESLEVNNYCAGGGLQKKNMQEKMNMLCKRNETIQEWRRNTTPTQQMPSSHHLYCALFQCLQFEFQYEIIFDLLKKHLAPLK